jgi:hypothetical protein
MGKNLASALIGTAVFVFAMLAVLVFQETKIASASAPSGLPATVATSSTIVVGPNLVGTGILPVLFKADGTCDARVISTVGQPILLSFAVLSSTTPENAGGGVLQAASTTVSYDGGIYGCGLVSAYGFGASTTIDLIETQ